MRISYLMHQFSPKHTSSVEQYCFNLAKEMQNRLNEVSIFAYQYSRRGAKLQQGTMEIDCDGIKLREVYHNYQMLKEAKGVEYYNKIIRDYADLYFDEFKPDIVHILHLKNLSASVIDSAYEKDIPIVFTPTDFWMLCPNFTLLRPDFKLCRGPLMTTPCQMCLDDAKETLGQKIMDKKHQPLSMKLKERAADSFVSTITKEFVKKLTASMKVQKHWVGIDDQLERKEFILNKCSKIKKILAPSKFMKDVLAENGYEDDKITTLPLGFDIPSELVSEKIYSDKLRIAYIGTINKHKGVHTLIQAVKNISSDNIKLKIYGDFTRFHKYTEYVKNLAAHDKRISFKGTFRNEKTNEIFQKIDVLAVPSLWYENIPQTAYLALAHRTPVIAADFGAMPEIVQNGKNGFLFNRDDPADLQKKITDILNDMSILERLNESITPPKTISEHADELLNIFEEYTFCDKA